MTGDLPQTAVVDPKEDIKSFKLVSKTLQQYLNLLLKGFSMFLWDVSHFESFVSIYSSFVPRLLTCVFFLGFMSTLFLVPINRPQWATLTLRLSFFHWKRKRAGERERERCRPCLRQKVQAYKADRVHFTICLGSQPDLWFAVSLAALAVFISLPFCSAMSERAQE